MKTNISLRVAACIHNFLLVMDIWKTNTISISSSLTEPKLYKQWRCTIPMTNDRQIYRLNYQLQGSTHFIWRIIGQYDVIFIGTIWSWNLNLISGAYTRHLQGGGGVKNSLNLNKNFYIKILEINESKSKMSRLSLGYYQGSILFIESAHIPLFQNISHLPG